MDITQALSCREQAENIREISNNYLMGLISGVDFLLQVEVVVEVKKREYAEIQKELDKLLKPKTK
jgi:hypothetical protein